MDPATAFIKTLAPHLWVKACERSKIFELMLLKAKAEVPLKHIPFLVRFRDEKDPKTVEAVDPSNLAASFGVGVRLKRVTMETTSDAVTTSIEKRLGWLGQYYAMRLDGDRSVAHAVPPPSLANALSSGTFKVPKE